MLYAAEGANRGEGKIMKYIFIYLIKAYQIVVSPLLPNSCRFYPTCSEYSKQSYELYGVFRGTWMTITRLLRCHPFHPGGYDPVVPEQDDKEIAAPAKDTRV
jgi:uncharacterized protein